MPMQLRRDLNRTFNSMIDNVNAVLRFIRDNIKVKQIYFVKIIPRHYWSTGARVLANWVNFYILQTVKRRYHIKEISPRLLYQPHYQHGETILLGMLKTDVTHLNNLGNKALTAAIMRPILNKWFIQNKAALLPCTHSHTRKKSVNSAQRQRRIKRLKAKQLKRDRMLKL